MRNVDYPGTFGSRKLICNDLTGSVTVRVLFCFDGRTRTCAHSSLASELSE